MSSILMYLWNFATSIFIGMAIVIKLDGRNINFNKGKGQQMFFTFIALAPFAFARVLYLGWTFIAPLFKN